MPKVAIINASSTLTDDEVKAAVHKLQTQVHRHFAPVWGIDADLDFVSKQDEPAVGSWWLAILDNSDLHGDLAYHDLANEGLPLGKVFAATEKQNNHHWTASASHELLEMLVDPEISMSVSVQTGETTERLYAYEVCDAVQAEEFNYKIDGTYVSDIVYPAWFQTFHRAGNTQFDHGRHVKKALELLSGGYINVYDIPSGTGWQQIHAKGPHNYNNRPRLGQSEGAAQNTTRPMVAEQNQQSFN
jgi:hypothetical protein